MIKSKDEFFKNVQWPILYIDEGTIDFEFIGDRFETFFVGNIGLDNRVVIQPKKFNKPWKWQEKHIMINDNNDNQTKILKAGHFRKLTHALKKYGVLHKLKGVNMCIIKKGKDVEFIVYREKKGKIDMSKLNDKIMKYTPYCKNKTELIRRCGNTKFYENLINLLVKEGIIEF